MTLDFKKAYLILSIGLISDVIMVNSNYKDAFRALKDLNNQTALLELFDWNEDAFNEFTNDFIMMLNTAESLEELLVYIKEKYGDDIVAGVKKLINSQAQDISEDSIVKGVVYEA